MPNKKIKKFKVLTCRAWLCIWQYIADIGGFLPMWHGALSA
jgi:hypothetical protein